MTYRAREYTRNIKGAPGHMGMKNYFVYIGDYTEDYCHALRQAISWEKYTGNKTWVDCIDVEWPTEPNPEWSYDA